LPHAHQLVMGHVAVGLVMVADVECQGTGNVSKLILACAISWWARRESPEKSSISYCACGVWSHFERPASVRKIMEIGNIAEY